MSLYDVLGVPKNATHEEIKRAYRALSSKYHPDRGGGDPEKMSEINTAYGVLGDSSKREEYDRTGKVGGVKQTLEQKARQALFQMFAQVMTTIPDADLPHTDIFELVKKQFDKNLENNYEARGKLEKQIKLVEQIKKRVKGGDMMDQVFDSNILNAKNAIADLDETDKVIALTFTLMKGYFMECEQRPQAKPQMKPIPSVFGFDAESLATFQESLRKSGFGR